MEEKYIELLLKKCLDLKSSKILFINYDVVNKSFINKLVEQAKIFGIEEIYLDENDIYKERAILKKTNLFDIDYHEYFNRSIWNEYADKGANFIVFRAPNPGVMDDVDPSKVARAEYIKRKTSYEYVQKILAFQIPWCIAVLPNENWANKVFNSREDSLKLLENTLYDVCMVDENDPIDNWNKQLETNSLIVEKLNNLKIKLLHYKNSLGTDLTLELLDKGLWCDASKDGLVNIPSYEIFTTPDYRKANGIVYSSKPLIYNGAVIDEFWIKFENGKAIGFDAKKGKEILRGIITSDENACYLGECALVEKDSPVAKTGITFGLTLLDENSSCHLALGRGFPNCYQNGKDLSESQLLDNGVNISKAHVDFMIGTPDLNIEAETIDGTKIKILENGKFTKF